jgi:hypothetical protein
MSSKGRESTTLHCINHLNAVEGLISKYSVQLIGGRKSQCSAVEWKKLTVSSGLYNIRRQYNKMDRMHKGCTSSCILTPTQLQNHLGLASAVLVRACHPNILIRLSLSHELKEIVAPTTSACKANRFGVHIRPV